MEILPGAINVRRRLTTGQTHQRAARSLSKDNSTLKPVQTGPSSDVNVSLMSSVYSSVLTEQQSSRPPKKLNEDAQKEKEIKRILKLMDHSIIPNVLKAKQKITKNGLKQPTKPHEINGNSEQENKVILALVEKNEELIRKQFELEEKIASLEKTHQIVRKSQNPC